MHEDEIVAAIRAIAEPSAMSALTLGIGDDAALWQPSRSHRSAITSDMLVEGVHFTPETMSLYDAGWRATIANASDLAAMGARPVLMTVALGIPPHTGDEGVLELYRGLADAARHVKLAIAGGDMSRSAVLTIAITAVGEVSPSRAKTRSGGHAGDVLAVTGPLGAARAGLDEARSPGSLEGALAQAALQAFRRPEARLLEGRFLAASRNVRAMMDCSDGLSTDLDRLCIASGCGAALESVPVAQPAEAVARHVGEDPQRYALAGGEEFELLVAVRARAFAHLAAHFQTRFRRPLHRLGTLRPEPGITWEGRPLERSGWDHFDGA